MKMTGHEANARKGCWAPALRAVVPGGGPRKAHLPKALRVLVFAMACPLRVKGQGPLDMGSRGHTGTAAPSCHASRDPCYGISDSAET